MSLFWLIIAIFAGVVEALTLTFGFAFVTVAGLAAALLAVLGLSIPGQVAAFSVILVLSLLLLRPRLVARFGGPGVPSRSDRLVGRTGEVIEALDPVRGTGRVVVAGHDWAARSSDPLPVGARIDVQGADGIVLLVRPAGADQPPVA